MKCYVLLQQLSEPITPPIKINLNADEVRVGRRTISHLHVYPQVSKDHALFSKLMSGSIFVHDLNSRNGLYINGVKIGQNSQLLNVGDIIGFGVPCLDERKGFVCALTESNVEIDNFTYDESAKESGTNSTRNSLSTISKRLIENTSLGHLCNGNRLENGIGHFSSSNVSNKRNNTRCSVDHNFNSSTLNKTKTYDYLESSRIQSCGTGSSSSNKVHSRYDVQQSITNTSATLKTSNKSQPEQFSIDSIPIKYFQVVLQKCDSKNFETPEGIKTPFKKQKVGTESKTKCVFLPKRKKRIQKLSDFSSDSDEENSTDFINPEENNFKNIKHNMTENATNNMNKKRKVLDDVFPSSSSSLSDQYLSHEDGPDYFSARTDPKDKSHTEEKNSYKSMREKDELCYSQKEKPFTIFDDESYLDSQNYVFIQEEPSDVQEDIANQDEDALCKQIFEDPESLLSVSSIQEHIIDDVETIENITAFFGSSGQNKSKTVESSRTIPEMKLILECEESDASSSNEEEAYKAYCSVKMPLGDSNVGNIAEKCEDITLKDTVDNSFNFGLSKDKPFKKSNRRTIYIEAKPLKQQRSPNMRGRREAFVEKKKYQPPNTSTSKQRRLNKDLNLLPKIVQQKTSATAKYHENGPSTSAKDNSIAKSRYGGFATKNVARSAEKQKNSNVIPVSVTTAHDILENNSKENDYSMINVSKPPNKVNFNSSILKYASEHSWSSDSSARDFSQNALVSLNANDSLQANTKSLSGNNIGKTNTQQVQDTSIILPSASVPSLELTTVKKNEDVKRSLSSNRESICKSFEINSRVLAKKLIYWKSIWLQEQLKCDKPPAEVERGAEMLPLHFASYDEYISRFYPMMKLELWDYMYTKSKEVFKDNRAVNKFYFSLISYTSKTDCIELKCESIVAERVSYSPRAGSMVVLDLKDATSKMCEPLFGYIFKHSVDKHNTSSLKIPGCQTLPKEWLTNAKHWTFYTYIKKKDMSFALGSLMEGNGICYIRRKLKLADALGQVGNSPLLAGIIKPDWPVFTVNYPESSPQAREYTSCQMRVINGISSEIIIKSQPKIVLVQGSPGTGKTHTIIGLLEKLVFDCETFRRILLVAPSNAAIDEIGCRLIDLNEQNQWRDRAITFVRVGSEKQIHEKVLPYFLDKKAKELFKCCKANRIDKELDDLRKQIAQNTDKIVSLDLNERLQYLKKELHDVKEQSLITEMDYHNETSYKTTILKECHIVLTTLNSCGSSILNRNFNQHSDVQFSCCIIDDATQCTELEVLQPLMFGIDKLVLFGDHKQSPSTVTSKLACKYEYNRSMFERLNLCFENNNHRSPVFTLNEQFRMHSQICEFPSKQFYSNEQLITDYEIDLRYSPFPLNPYVVLNITNRQESNELSLNLNMYVASVVFICKRLLPIIGSRSSIGIITPCQEQRSLYERALYENPDFRDIEVNTLDGFQGREKEVIIMSCVNTNNHSDSTGFETCKNRLGLNVAITRAKKCLIICCNASSLKANHEWTSLINDAHKREVLFNVTSHLDIPHLFEKCIKKNL